MDRITNFTQQIAALSNDSDIARLVTAELEYLRGRYAGNLLRRTLSRYRLAIKYAVTDENKQAVIFGLFEQQPRRVYKPRATNDQ